MDELYEMRKLIEMGKLLRLTAHIDLENVEKALKLTIPGIKDFTETIFNLSQSSDFIISILCSEIPYIISDLLSVLPIPVFYKGCLIMEVNGKLTLLYPTMHSFEVDLRSLTRNMHLKKRLQFERLFWLTTKRHTYQGTSFKRIVWCPIKESYRLSSIN